MRDGPSSRRHRIGLAVVVGLIVVSWVVRAARSASRLRNGEAAHSVTSVKAIAVAVPILAVITTLVVVVGLRASGERLRDLGFTRSRLRRQLLIGLGAAVLFVALDEGVFASLLRAAGVPNADEALAPLMRDPRELPLWLWVTTLGGGFTEELSRAFVVTRFRRIGGTRLAVVALLVDSVVFGLSHAYQGVGGVFVTGILGVGFGLVYLRRRRILESMSAHAIFDYIGVAAGYVRWGRW